MAHLTTWKIGLAGLAIVLTACGGGHRRASEEDGSSPYDDDDASWVGGDGQVGPTDGKVGDGGAAGDAENRDGASCLTACAADDCGEVPNGCDGFLSCAPCGTGLICGQNAPNKCGAPPPVVCTPLTAAQVCSGKCGAVSDGCSGVVVCGADNGGTVCGANQLCTNAVCTDSGATCTPLTCDDRHHACGQDGNGCGGVLDCGSCATGKICTYASAGNTCEDAPPPACTPALPADACNGTCGIVGDGCGAQIDCQMSGFGCPGGETCGGGGVPGMCGSGATACTSLPVATVCAGKCGSQSDGCGGAYACSSTNGGQTCNTAAGETCGGGGVANVCGTVPCSAKTQAQACPATGVNKSCGQQPDGCGALIDCGGCAQDQQCGLNTPSICGTIPSCQPIAVATACASKCGTVPDGCGGSYACTGANGGVSCTGNEYCGANGQANKCGAPAVSCVPKTCAQLGHTCGLASDGCGHVLNCWPSCSVTDLSCTGSCGDNSACLGNQTTGAQSCISGSPTCTGSLCSTVPTSCGAGSPTRLTGTVVTPGRLVSGSYINRLPVPNALVYIPADPNVALPTVFEGVQAGNAASCGRCEDEELVADGQSVLAAAVTDYKGAFTLEGRVPVGSAFKIVVKVGKWRRVVQVPSGVSAACATRSLTVDYTRLAANGTDGLTGTHLPKIAVSTGDVDAMECVLRGMGISESEFTVPSGTGRIHMYRANGTRMGPATCSGNYWQNGWRSCASNSNYGCVNGRNGCSWSDSSVADTTLYASQAAINAYDMVVFDCEGGGHYIRGANPLSSVLAYANNGGRVFASHWSYEWLDANGTMDQAAAWTSSGGSDNNATGYVSLPTGPTARTGANPVKSLVYRDWLDYQGALTGTVAGQLSNPATPQLAITDPRDVAGGSVGTSSDEWMYRNNSGAKVQQLSFNTPYGSAEDAICGRVAFSAFHVAATSSGSTLSTENLFFPAECQNGALTPQEKTLAFMLFDLGTCVSAGDPPQPPSCVPKTTADLCPGANDACGYLSDGCGGVIDCAGCASGYYCDGNTCRPQQCTPSTCASLGFNCGQHADGCGGIARNAQGTEGCGTCSGGQICGLNSPGICGGCVQIPLATACPANSCGTVSDGCGGTYNCGPCPTGVCGGGGPNLCGTNSCTAIPQATACANKNCGLVADGCGGTYTCGTCVSPDTCGGGGAPNVCGHPVCTPKTLAEACNGLSCGWVSDGCGGALNCGGCPNSGVCGGAGPNQCGSSCTPTTCSAAGAECGVVADLCGSLLNCGNCPSGQTCGAAGPNKCGGGTCTATTCNAVGAECGLIGDGCGSVLDCGECTAPETCGGAGVANQCGTGTGGCNPLTCGGQAVECGAASDGCGGLLDCGGCPSGYYCERSKCVAAQIFL